MAFLVLLERLSPVERAVLLLRDMFDFGFDEIADTQTPGPGLIVAGPDEAARGRNLRTKEAGLASVHVARRRGRRPGGGRQATRKGAP